MKEKLKRNRFLRNKKSFIFLLILCLGVGFAFLSTQLNITGNTSVSGNKWSVYFDNVQVSEGSVDASVVPTTTGTTTTSLNYTVLLDKPGDFYEFTVDAVNAGTIDAMVESINMTSLDTDVAKYLNYTATYSDGTVLAQNDVLDANDTVTYKVRVEYKKDIVASDLDENDTNLTLTFGVNYVQSTIDTTTLFAVMKRQAQSEDGLDFLKAASDTNGKGIYVRSGTENNTYPVYYYRGKVSDNNVMFAGFCWKAVRTTETGGTKLIYNGTPKTLYKNKEQIDSSSYINVVNSETAPFAFDDTNKVWTNTNNTNYEQVTMTFSVKEAGDYILNYNFDYQYSMMIEAYFYKDGTYLGDGRREGTIELYNLTPSSVITVKYSKDYWEENDEGLSFYMLKGVGKGVLGCDNNYGDITQVNTSKFNTENDSIAYSGYMYGTAYPYKDDMSVSGNYVYGSNFTYSNGSYTLTNMTSDVEEIATHHYTCFNTTGTCNELNYIFSKTSGNNGVYRYITLENGKSIEDAFRDMNTNTNDSTVKTAIDNWFNNTFKTYFTNLNKDYNDYLEDTVWCNDRSFLHDESDNAFEKSGWNPNGGPIIAFSGISFSTSVRKYAGTPTLVCENKNDSFTVNDTTNGNGALTYPVGLLTSDEVMLAGCGDGSTSGDNSYLYTRKGWWTMSPGIYYATALVFNMSNSNLFENNVINSEYGFRPSISIAKAVKIQKSGDGTPINPYKFIVE